MHYVVLNRIPNCMVYTIPEVEALEENLHSTFSMIQDKENERILLKKMHPDAIIPTRGTEEAAGHDLYMIEDQTISAKGQQVVKTGIFLRIPDGTYGRIAPRSGLAVKYGITVNTGVINQEYMGEIGVVLVNLFDQDYQIRQGDRIAQLIPEKIMKTECQEGTNLDETGRGTRGFGSTETRKIEIEEISIKTLIRTQHKEDINSPLWRKHVNGQIKLWATNSVRS